MKCKRCNKEYFESELTNGFCKDCLIKIEKQQDIKNKAREQAKNIGKTVIISSLISIILSVSFVVWLVSSVNGTNVSIDDFTVSNLSFTEDLYGGNSYSGTANIYCTDTSHDFILEIAITLLSGGNSEDIGKTYYTMTVMHNGVAEISTYDYGTSSNPITCPNYLIEVIGFRNFNV